MQLVVRQQLHAAREIVLQHAQRRSCNPAFSLAAISSSAFWNASRSSVFVPYENKPSSTSDTPSLPGRRLQVGTCAARSPPPSPSGWSCRSSQSAACRSAASRRTEASMASAPSIHVSAVAAHSGSTTGLVGLRGQLLRCRQIPCPKPASPFGTGFNVAVIELVSTRYCFATRFTSASVTRFIASTSSSGDFRPSRRQRLRPHIGQTGNRVALELRLRHLAALGRFHQVFGNALAPHSSPGSPRISAMPAVGSVPAGSTITPYPTLAFGYVSPTRKRRLQRLARRHHRVQIAALARQHIRQESASPHNPETPFPAAGTQ